MASSKESGLVKKVVQALRDRGAWATKIHGNIYSQGVPDVLCCYRGYFLAFELKLPGKERNLTDLQRHQLESIKAAGGVGMMITTVKQAMAVLDKIDKVKDG